MNYKSLLLIFFLLINVIGYSQSSFNYSVELKPISIPSLPGLHSYAYAQHNNLWLIVGGRKDGIHARQPFNAFPALQNNTDIYVINVATKQFWQASINSLAIGLHEQLQSTNMNFYQDNDTLYIIGGYGFSSTANDHITFPNLTSVNVSGLISAIQSNSPISGYFKQITDSAFAVTGGHLKKLKGKFYLVGGHRFDGRYNPMGNPTYTQTYTNQIRKFNIYNSGTLLSYSNYSTITDPVHLRRRDYNLLPQIFPNGEEGFTISSGVFQIGVDLPFLYPVNITDTNYSAITSFNQYLSNYHSAVACLYDSTLNEMHSLFFGGMSQYYYSNGNLIQDNQVPFVKTISRLTRDANGVLHEYQLTKEMPSLKGASAEFIYNLNLQHYHSKIIKLHKINQDTTLIGHIYGGIYSPTQNPFSNNTTNTTIADNTIYEVLLIKNNSQSNINAINGNNPYDVHVFPNPSNGHFSVGFSLLNPTITSYYITNAAGEIVKEVFLNELQSGKHEIKINLQSLAPQQLVITFVFENKFFVSKKIFIQ